MSRAVCDAVLALGHLAEQRRPVLVEQLAQATGVSRPSLAKVVSALVRRGLVTTRRGIGGGAVLAPSAADITLFDLCSALDDPILAPACLLGAGHDPSEVSCPAGGIEERHHREMLRFLRETPVLEVAGPYRRLKHEDGTWRR